MSSLVRRVCICCLALLLPLQGLAAGCLMVCAGSHPQALAAGPEAVAHPCHADAVPSGDGAEHVEHVAAPDDTGHRCSACAACGAAPALPAAAPLLFTPEAARDVGTPTRVRLASAPPVALERPPRARTA